jgi:hypothetical protein
LAFVMAGALAVFGVAYRSSGARSTPLLAPRFVLAIRGGIDRQLVAGSLIFGVGWGLSGFCPGPAIVGSAFGDWRVWLFVGAMLVGMMLYRWWPGPQPVPREA